MNKIIKIFLVTIFLMLVVSAMGSLFNNAHAMNKKYCSKDTKYKYYIDLDSIWDASGTRALGGTGILGCDVYRSDGKLLKFEFMMGEFVINPKRGIMDEDDMNNVKPIKGHKLANDVWYALNNRVSDQDVHYSSMSIGGLYVFQTKEPFFIQLQEFMRLAQKLLGPNDKMIVENRYMGGDEINIGPVNVYIWSGLLRAYSITEDDGSEYMFGITTTSPSMKTPSGIHCGMSLRNLKRIYNGEQIRLVGKDWTPFYSPGNRTYAVHGLMDVMFITVKGTSGLDSPIIKISIFNCS